MSKKNSSHCTHQSQSPDLSPFKPPPLQPPVDHHGILTSSIATPQISHSPFDNDNNHPSMLTSKKTAQQGR